MTFSERMRMWARLWKYRLREESESLAFMRRQPLAGRTVLDVGANKGIYSYWMSRQVGPRGQVIAFEPQPDLRPHLEDLKQAFRLSNLRIVAQGLSNQRGLLQLRRDKPGALGATLEPMAPDETAAAPMGETIAVDVRTLDDFAREAELADVAFIKCDVEGHELAVFQGGRQLLSGCRPALLFECHHAAAERGELFEFLRSLGYDGVFMQGRRAVHYSKFAEFPYRKPTIRHRNYMFTRVA